MQRAIGAHLENLKLLAMPLNQLTKEICKNNINPSCFFDFFFELFFNFFFELFFNLVDYDEGKKLRKILDKVDEMRLQRFQFFSKLTSDLEHDDITKKILIFNDSNIHVFFTIH